MGNSPKGKGRKKSKIFAFIISVILVVSSAVGVSLHYFNITNESEYNDYSEDYYTTPPVDYPVEEIQLDEPEILPDEEPPEPEAEPELGLRPILPQVLALREEFGNDDIIGHLSIHGTNIDNLVVQYYDNEFYLYRDVFGRYNAAGTLFLDYDNDASNLSRNNIIYGHNMRDGSKFHNVRFYTNRAFFDEHRYIHFTTMHYETVWEIFAFYDTHISFNYIQVYFPTDESFLALVEEMKRRSIHETDVQVDQDDLILTLSTCTNAHPDWRYVINAKLISRVSVEDQLRTG